MLRRVVAFILGIFARLLLFLKKPKIIAVTGSVGKTSTKLAIAKVLRSKYKVLAGESSYNTEFGLPLSLFSLETPKNVFNPFAWLLVFLKIFLTLFKSYPYHFVVLEMGADQQGDIARFMHYIKPDVGVVTAVQRVHMALFRSIEAVFEEKSLVARNAKVAVLNSNDSLLAKKLKPELNQKVVTYGVENNVADINITDVKRNGSGTFDAHLVTAESQAELHTNLLAKHSLGILAAAAAVGRALGIEDNQIIKSLENIKPVKGRLQKLSGKNGSIIIDDSYNASPISVILALQTLKDFPGKRKVAILGSMNELGEFEEEGHKLVAEEIEKLQVDQVYTIGEVSGRHIPSLKNFNSPYEAGKYVSGILKGGDVVLVKGSQNKIFSEEVVAILLENENDKNLLVRQSSIWQKIKRTQFPDA